MTIADALSRVKTIAVEAGAPPVIRTVAEELAGGCRMLAILARNPVTLTWCQVALAKFAAGPGGEEEE